MGVSRARSGARPLAVILVAACALVAVPEATAARRTCAQKAARTVKNMPLKARAGQMVMVAVIPEADGTPSSATRQLIVERRVGSVIVFGAGSPGAAARNNNEMQSWAGRVPLLIAADNEFGAAHRVPYDTTVLPLAMGIGATRRPRDAKTAARITGTEARAMGFNWSLAPVADVNTNPANPVIGVRSFGGRPSLVERMAGAEVRGVQNANVIATPKHFPGHGATSVDSHTGLPVVHYGRKRLRRVHMRPFQHAIEAGTDSIMTAHIIVKSVDPHRPATLSKRILRGILRSDMKFRGLIVTDDMSMDAISDHYGTREATQMAARAGADVIMVTGDYGSQSETVSALVSGVRSGALSKKRVNKAAKRVVAMKCRYGVFDDRYVSPRKASAISGRKKSRSAAARIARRTITLVKNKRDLLPYSRRSRKRVLVTGAIHTTRLARAARSQTRAVVDEYVTGLDPSQAQIEEAVRRAHAAKRVIVATYSRTSLPGSQASLVKRLKQTGRPVVAISLGLPYDLASYRKVRAYIAAYAQGPWPSVTPPPLRAAIKVVFGAQPGGKLPVGIGDLYGFGRGLHYPRD